MLRSYVYPYYFKNGEPYILLSRGRAYHYYGLVRLKDYLEDRIILEYHLSSFSKKIIPQGTDIYGYIKQKEKNIKIKNHGIFIKNLKYYISEVADGKKKLEEKSFDIETNVGNKTYGKRFGGIINNPWLSVMGGGMDWNVDNNDPKRIAIREFMEESDLVFYELDLMNAQYYKATVKPEKLNMAKNFYEKADKNMEIFNTNSNNHLYALLMDENEIEQIKNNFCNKPKIFNNEGKVEDRDDKNNINEMYNNIDSYNKLRRNISLEKRELITMSISSLKDYLTNQDNIEFKKDKYYAERSVEEFTTFFITKVFSKQEITPALYNNLKKPLKNYIMKIFSNYKENLIIELQQFYDYIVQRKLNQGITYLEKDGYKLTIHESESSHALIIKFLSNYESAENINKDTTDFIVKLGLEDFMIYCLKEIKEGKIKMQLKKEENSLTITTEHRNIFDIIKNNLIRFRAFNFSPLTPAQRATPYIYKGGVASKPVSNPAVIMSGVSDEKYNDPNSIHFKDSNISHLLENLQGNNEDRPKKRTISKAGGSGQQTRKREVGDSAPVSALAQSQPSASSSSKMPNVEKSKKASGQASAGLSKNSIWAEASSKKEGQSQGRRGGNNVPHHQQGFPSISGKSPSSSRIRGSRNGS